MTAYEAIKTLYKSALITERNVWLDARDLAISALEQCRWHNMDEPMPETDTRVVGYFGGGALDQLRWFDFVATLSDGRVVSESTERNVINEHCIAWYQLPEPPQEEQT